jgi:hypothetical protein
LSPAAKYTLGRLGLFVVVLLALWPVELNLLIKLMVAVAFSAASSFFLLRRWRDEMAAQMADAAQRRKAEKDRLRSALAGDERTEPTGPPAGPRAGESPDGPNPPVDPEAGPPAR